jgi:carboxyl-terminal processing protease
MPCRKDPEPNFRRRLTLLRGLLLCFGALGVGAVAKAADFASDVPRVALVIGNGAYRTGPLHNPVPDANAVAGGLRRMGFQVTLRENASRRDLIESLREFVLEAAIF